MTSGETGVLVLSDSLANLEVSRNVKRIWKRKFQ